MCTVLVCDHHNDHNDVLCFVESNFQIGSHLFLSFDYIGLYYMGSTNNERQERFFCFCYII